MSRLILKANSQGRPPLEVRLEIYRERTAQTIKHPDHRPGLSPVLLDSTLQTLELAARRCKILPLLLRAGASINEPAIAEKYEDLTNPNISPHYRKAIRYLRAVHVAGGFPAYARAHRSMFAAIFSRGTRLPADVIPKIVDYWAHLGWYEYSVPGTGSRVVATGPEESSSS